MASNDRVLPNFQRANVPLMLLWIPLTIGLFIPWWLYRQTRVINAHSKAFKIPGLLVHVGMVSWVVYIIIAFANQPHGTTTQSILTMPVEVQLAGFAANVIMLIWTMFVRVGINVLSGAKVDEAHWISFSLTLLAAVFCIASLRSWLGGRHWVAAVWFAAALLSKEEAVAFPIFLLALHWSISFNPRELRVIGVMLLAGTIVFMIAFAAAVVRDPTQLLGRLLIGFGLGLCWLAFVSIG